jgi:hypothetical protein
VTVCIGGTDGAVVAAEVADLLCAVGFGGWAHAPTPAAAPRPKPMAIAAGHHMVFLRKWFVFGDSWITS